MAANRIADVYPNKPFFIWVANLSGRPIKLAKGTIVASAVTDVSKFVHLPLEVVIQ